MSSDTQRRLALGQELLNAVRLINAGFGQLQSLSGENDFYHLPLLTLASGFERFMKATLCFCWLEEYNNFPDEDTFPSGQDGHNLKLLLDRVCDKCFLDEYVNNIPVAQTDFEYLRSTELLSFLSILSDFGQSGRYYNLDIVTGRDPQTEDPDPEWQRLETNILLARKDLMSKLNENSASRQIRAEINKEVIVRLEKLARALARLYTIGKIGDEAKRYLGYIGCFLRLTDAELGTKEYDLTGSTF